MSWERVLDRHGKLIEDELKDYFISLKEEREYHPFITEVYTTLEDFVFRKGKRLASCSTLLTYSGYANKIDARILRVSMGVELYRHCILIHDDLVDRDDFRRGEKTIHKLFSEVDRRFGEGISVFLGNIVYSLAVRAMLNSDFEVEKLVNVLNILSEGYRDVNESQILDLLFEQKEVDTEEWYVMASKRAASLFKVSILIGAVLSGVSERELKILEEAATNIGYAFDIQDDIIDTYASEEQYGRPPCRDITLSKKPLHVVYALSSENREKSESLRRLLGNKLDEKEIEQLRSIIIECRGLEAAKKRSKIHAEKAKKLIIKTNLNDETKKFFVSFINYIEDSLDWYN